MLYSLRSDLVLGQIQSGQDPVVLETVSQIDHSLVLDAVGLERQGLQRLVAMQSFRHQLRPRGQQFIKLQVQVLDLRAPYKEVFQERPRPERDEVLAQVDRGEVHGVLDDELAALRPEFILGYLQTPQRLVLSQSSPYDFPPLHLDVVVL